MIFKSGVPHQDKMNYTTIILAAGMGTRLHPLTLNKPKCLLEIAGESFISRTIKTCLNHHIKKFIIVLGFEAEQISQHIHNTYPNLPVQFVINKKYNETNTGYSLFLALKQLTGSFVLFDGDLLFDPKLLNLCLETDSKNAMVTDIRIERLDEEALKARANADNAIIELGKKIPLSKAHGEFIGLCRFSEKNALTLRSMMETTFANSSNNQLYYEDVISNSLDKYEKVALVPTKDYLWSEVDTLEDLEHIRLNWNLA
ncbi:MAG: hypothetical protein A2048_03250 [Deltaproteobacteria bacterium GWA2_45_12]|nr:MAG: hypothetical protein A2048_03250 [Deltaproteobacteria bacterium GWA2_45_12]